MKRPLLIGLTVVTGLVFWLNYALSSKDATLKRERSKVHALIEVGQDLSEAEGILRKNGYRLYHEKSIQPTVIKDYSQQLVIIGNTKPSGLDAFFYTTTGGANSLRNESSYVVIDASNDGVITRID